MIIRIIAVDPRPRNAKDDTVVYQVPERSRAEELLYELFEDAGIDYVKIEHSALAKTEDAKE